MDIIVKKQDIPKNKIIELSKRPKVLVVFDGKNYYAFNGICTHAKWPLDQGNLNENILTCVAHGYQFDITNGDCLNNPGRDLKMYDIDNKDDEIIITTG
jgi:nitrite reductase/ring-hydroxylating ferredoxin subunit|tara:strand:+ start:529 stop:825 length:297 start_codon:yes stop_codon:yes gene_type:complete